MIYSQAFILSLVKPAYMRIGSQFLDNEDPITKFLRISLHARACVNGFRQCVRESQKLFDAWMDSSDPVNQSNEYLIFV